MLLWGSKCLLAHFSGNKVNIEKMDVVKAEFVTLSVTEYLKTT